MSFCTNGTRNTGHVCTLNYLRLTAQKIKSNLQCWIANFLGHGWFYTNTLYASAQTGGLLFPIGQIRVNPECEYSLRSIYNQYGSSGVGVRTPGVSFFSSFGSRFEAR